MRKLLLASAVALSAMLLADAPAVRAADAENQDISSGCGDTIFCGWWYWVLPGPRGGVGGAGTCYAGDRNCIPNGATNPGQPGGECFDNPYSDGCEGNTSWSTGSSSSQGSPRPGSTRTRNGRR
jgi:hypothetical protein